MPDLTTDLGQEFLTSIRCNRVAPDGESRLDFISTSEFDSTEYRREWLVERILVSGQACVVGGPKKCMKTSTLVDLAYALASGSSFLNRFSVPTQCRVGLMSGESGEATLQETYRRVRASRQFPLPHDQVGLFWSFELPRLSDDSDLAVLESRISDNDLDVLILDPLYLSLLSGNIEASASNLYDIGPLLSDAARACLEAGATPVFAHHTKKGSKTSALDLEDLAFAGIQEFARSWILLGRRRAYEPGSGLHELWLNVGGSAGYSGQWALDIDEGVTGLRFDGRKWDVEVRTAAQEGEVQRQHTSRRNEEKTREERDKVLDFLSRSADGESKSAIRDAIGIGRRITALLAEMVQAGEIDVATGLRKGNRRCDGFRLPQIEEDDVEEVD